jgi:hypothetical protein
MKRSENKDEISEESCNKKAMITTKCDDADGKE